MSFRYQADHSGTGDLMRSSEIRTALEHVASDAQRFAESISPRDTGTYASSFHTETGEKTVARERRAYVDLVNDADHAGGVEGRSHVLSRTRDYIDGLYG